jgi:Ca2+-binding RTX toxin-like protein
VNPDPTTPNSATATTTVQSGAPKCPGYESDPRNQVVGTPGADVLTGTNGDDIICGLGGNDTLKGSKGADLLLGGDGIDSLYGGAGNDTFNGGPGSDTVFFSESATTGPETVDLAAGTATSASLGSDTFIMAGSFSTVENATGTRFDDVFTGDAGANQLLGGIGNDTLAGADGSDSLLGSSGNDSLTGGQGNDLLQPGTGNDATVDGGNGQDILSYADVTSGGGIVLDVGAGTVGGGAGTDSFTGMNVYVGSPQADSMTGSTGVDTLLGTGGADTISGGAGADTLTGGAGGDSIDGGLGQDVATYLTDPSGITADMGTGTVTDGYGSTDSITGIEAVMGSDAGADTITGSTGPNRAYGNGGDDSLSGLAGNDYLNGGAGTDTADGGPGTDTCVSVENPSNCEVIQTRPLGADSDLAKAWASARAERRALAAARTGSTTAWGKPLV